MSDGRASVKAKPAALANPAAPFSRWERAVAGRYLRARRKEAGVALISWIAFLGTLAAVAILIIVMSVMNGFRTELLDRMLGFNGHITIGGPIMGDPPLRAQMIARVRKVPGVVSAVPMVEAQGLALGAGQALPMIARGVEPEDLKRMALVSKNIKAGSMEGFGQGEDGGELVLVGSELASQLAIQPGDFITLLSPAGRATIMGSSPNQKDFTVGGIFTVGMSQYDQVFVYMPLSQAQLFFGRDTAIDKVEVTLASADDARLVKEQIAAVAGPGAVVSDWTESNQAFFTALQVERNTMRLILMLLVIIAALNIISGLIMLVKNKGRDIAILRTMGATRSSILRIFVMSGAAIGFTGTLAGLLVGVLFCLNIEAIQNFVEWATGTQVFNAKVYFLSHIPAKVQWSEVALIVGFSFLVSLLATLLPAFSASRLDPVEALRYE